MKGLIQKALAGAFGIGLLALSGCCGTGCGYDDLVDPCYPERYWASSRHEVNEGMAPQMMNGHILEQTVFDEQFEPSSDKLTPGGLEHLKYLARRRPHADPVIFLQTAQDVVYDPDKPDTYGKARAELNAKRIQAIQKFLVAYTDGAPQGFHVVVHDPHEVGQSAIGVAQSVRMMYSSYQGSLQIGTSGTVGSSSSGSSSGASSSGSAGGGLGGLTGH